MAGITVSAGNLVSGHPLQFAQLPIKRRLANAQHTRRFERLAIGPSVGCYDQRSFHVDHRWQRGLCRELWDERWLGLCDRLLSKYATGTSPVWNSAARY